MIAEYSGFSRVTIYKYFRTKEELFLAVCNSFAQEHMAESELFLQQEPDFWLRLEQVLFSWIISPFEAIGDELVLDDIISAHNRITRTQELGMQRRAVEVLGLIIDDAARDGQIDIAAKGLTVSDVAEMVSLVIGGLGDRKIDEIRGAVGLVIKFLRATLAG